MEFGATHTLASIDEALAALTDSHVGPRFDKVIMTMGVGNGEVLGEAFWLGGKRGKIVVTNIHPALESRASMPAARPDADGEAARRLAVRLGATRATTSPS